MYDVKKKEENIKLLNMQMLNKTLSMFEYINLPDSIPQKELEKILQTKGYCFITKVDGVLYPLTGSLGGELDVYGNFTQIIINNPAIKLSKTFNIETDGVLISNDDLQIGLMPIFDKLNFFLIENDINMMMWGYNSRQQKSISASDDKTKTSAESYINKLINGDLSVIADTPFLDSLTVHASNSSGGTRVSEFLELHQYLKSNLYNEVGISSNFNMKKERLISSELDVGEDSLFPLVYTMMKNRIIAVDKINSMFELDVVVDFGSIWALKNKKLVDGVKNNDENNQLETVVTDSDRAVNEHIQEEEVILGEDGKRDEDQGQNPVIVPEVTPLNSNDESEVVETEVVETEVIEDTETNLVDDLKPEVIEDDEDLITKPENNEE